MRAIPRTGSRGFKLLTENGAASQEFHSKNGTRSEIATNGLLPFTFAYDQNQLLSEAESEASMVIVGPGVISVEAPRGAPPPSRKRMVIVRNNNAFPVEWFWYGGAGLVIPPGKAAIIGGDGANAVLVGWLA